MSIAVLPKYRNKGIGTLLMNKIKELDNDIVSLYVLTNNEGAIKFYEGNGFEFVKRIDDYYDTLETKSAFYYTYENI